jgi:AraC-like DNA-binding protein
MDARRQYAQNIDAYLRYCYVQRTAARVSELADLLGRPRPCLSRVIVQLFGKSLHRILRERKLGEACRLLCETRLPLTEIAVASAFGTEKTFYRVFRNALGMTPGEYRRRRGRLGLRHLSEAVVPKGLT